MLCTTATNTSNTIRTQTGVAVSLILNNDTKSCTQYTAGSHRNCRLMETQYSLK